MGLVEASTGQTLLSCTDKPAAGRYCECVTERTMCRVMRDSGTDIPAIPTPPCFVADKSAAIAHHATPRCCTSWRSGSGQAGAHSLCGRGCDIGRIDTC